MTAQSVASGTPISSAQSELDRRARLRPFDTSVARNNVYGDRNGIMNLLYETHGMVWPYTPSIAVQQNIEYTQLQMIHTNQEFHAYSRTPAFTFTCTGPWTCQNIEEKNYAFACFHFLRTVSKMRFGETDSLRGTPPPMLLFSAHGNMMFNDLPVIVTNWTIDLLNDVDYVKLTFEDLTAAYLPSRFTMSVTMTVQQTPKKLRQEFNYDRFKSGELVKRGGWF